jgi:hypothetical protein
MKTQTRKDNLLNTVEGSGESLLTNIKLALAHPRDFTATRRELLELIESGQIVVMPARLTAENGAKASLIGEFFEEVETMTECPREGGCNDPECDGHYHTGMQQVAVEWTTIKAIYARAVEHFNVSP